jgi:hypothetical protein
LENDEPITLTDFLSGVGQLKFRGTSVLFRLPKSIIDNYKFCWKYNLRRNLQSSEKKRILDTSDSCLYFNFILFLLPRREIVISPISVCVSVDRSVKLMRPRCLNFSKL